MYETVIVIPTFDVAPHDGSLSGRLHGWEGTVDWPKIGSVGLKYP